MTGIVEPQPALLPPAEAAAAAVSAGSVEQMRVLTWNVQHAKASRTHQQAVWLATTDPHDILVLTEGRGRRDRAATGPAAA